jgi:predicted amidophosphoribosyltransferase
MSKRGPHICPQCGERVSAFAAGCAICGAELDPGRANHAGQGPDLRGRARALPSWRRLFPSVGDRPKRLR